MAAQAAYPVSIASHRVSARRRAAAATCALPFAAGAPGRPRRGVPGCRGSRNPTRVSALGSGARDTEDHLLRGNSGCGATLAKFGSWVLLGGFITVVYLAVFKDALPVSTAPAVKRLKFEALVVYLSCMDALEGTLGGATAYVQFVFAVARGIVLLIAETFLACSEWLILKGADIILLVAEAVVRSPVTYAVLQVMAPIAAAVGGALAVAKAAVVGVTSAAIATVQTFFGIGEAIQVATDTIGDVAAGTLKATTEAGTAVTQTTGAIVASGTELVGDAASKIAEASQPARVGAFVGGTIAATGLLLSGVTAAVTEAALAGLFGIAATGYTAATIVLSLLMDAFLACWDLMLVSLSTVFPAAGQALSTAGYAAGSTLVTFKPFAVVGELVVAVVQVVTSFVIALTEAAAALVASAPAPLVFAAVALAAFLGVSSAGSTGSEGKDDVGGAPPASRLDPGPKSRIESQRLFGDETVVMKSKTTTTTTTTLRDVSKSEVAEEPVEAELPPPRARLAAALELAAPEVQTQPNTKLERSADQPEPSRVPAASEPVKRTEKSALNADLADIGGAVVGAVPSVLGYALKATIAAGLEATVLLNDSVEKAAQKQKRGKRGSTRKRL